MTAPVRLTEALADRYRVERELGQGGMATVYLAQDLRHGRKVALKVLRPELSAILGGERFLKEIELTAALQHPHILPLHDSGEAGGHVYYVMPYVEGESLRDRLHREKQLPIADAVRIATEVASALDYAHRHGVIHRDIKPENILLHDGSALVADFGIALAASTAGGGTRMTETGMSLGTPHYMSPEQALGEREITARSDVYALGCVLYEMLTAEPPFTGNTAQAIIARVMTEQPRSIALQRHTVPPHVEAAVTQALEKLPADRFASAAEFAAALANPAFGAATLARTVATPVASFRSVAPSLRRAVLALSALTVAALALAAWALLRPTPPAPVHRFALALPTSQTPDPTALFAISPDGARLVFDFRPPGGGSQLWLKERDRYEATPIPGTDGAFDPTFSPDGKWLAFVQAGQLRKLQVTGGTAVTLADSTAALPGVAWLDDGTLVYARLGRRELRQVSEGGGATRAVWADSGGQVENVVALPGSRGVLFTRCVGGCQLEQGLHALDLRDGTTRLLQPGAIRGFYARTGHVLFVRPDGALLAVRFDPDRLEPSGTPVPIRDSISVVDGTVALLALSDEGTLVFRAGAPGASASRYRMVWKDRDGRETEVDSSWTFRHAAFGANAGWSLSPDGTRLAIGLSTDAGDNIWVKHLPAGPVVRVTFDSASEYRPRWTPDGRSVVFGSNRAGRAGLYRRPADGTGVDSLILRGQIYEGQLSPDGRVLVARGGGQISVVGGRNIGVMRLGVDTALVPLVATSFDESELALSPDARWLAYVSDETGRPEVFIRPFPDAETAKYQVSTGGGVAPLWARNGRELFYITPQREMVVVPIAPGPALALGARRVLFRLDPDLYLLEREFYTPFDISPDGRRFLLARRIVGDSPTVSPLLVTLNWFEELRRQLGDR